MVSLIHGLRETLGENSVTDYPYYPVYYEIPPDARAYELLKSHYIHGP